MVKILKKLTQKSLIFGVISSVVLSVFAQLVFIPTANAQTYGYAPIYLSQTSISVNVGQTLTVNVYGGSGNYFISSNSNSTAVSAGASNSLVQVQGLSQGSSSLTICSQASPSPCATLIVNVTGGTWNSSNISLSQTSLPLNIGQTQIVTISGTSGSYFIANNPNSSIATAYISGSQVVVTGNQSGSLSFSICSPGFSSQCTSLFVQVGSGIVNNNNNNWNLGWNNNWNSGWNTSWNSGWNNWQYPVNNNFNPYNYLYNQQSFVQPTYTYVQPTYTYAQPTYTVSGQPVSGVFLNQVPATGTSPGAKTLLLVLSLMFWSAAIAYAIHIYTRPRYLVSISENAQSGHTRSNSTQFNVIQSDKALAFKLAQQQKVQKKMQA